MRATFEIYNSNSGITFKLVDGRTTLCTAARSFDVVCDAEKAIVAIKRNCTNPSRVQVRKQGDRRSLLIVSENGRPLAKSVVVEASKTDQLQKHLAQCCLDAQIVDHRPNKRGGPGACVIG